MPIPLQGNLDLHLNNTCICFLIPSDSTLYALTKDISTQGPSVYIPYRDGHHVFPLFHYFMWECSNYHQVLLDRNSNDNHIKVRINGIQEGNTNWRNSKQRVQILSDIWNRNQNAGEGPLLVPWLLLLVLEVMLCGPAAAAVFGEANSGFASAALI